MRPKLHVLQGEGVGRNKMPARRIEVSAVTALDALVPSCCATTLTCHSKKSARCSA